MNNPFIPAFEEGDTVEIRGDSRSLTAALNAATVHYDNMTKALSKAQTEILNTNSAIKIQEKQALANAHALRQMVAELTRQKNLDAAGGIAGPPKQIGAQIAQLQAVKANAMLAAQGVAQLNNQMAALGGSKQAIQTVNSLTSSTKQARTASEELHLSWRSMMRLFGVQIAHRFAADLISGFREGVVQANELVIKIGQIQTLSQDAVSGTRAWAEALQGVSASFGFDILDTASAAYEALSNQMGKGIDIIGFMEEANKLAIATNSKQIDAVNFLSSVLNSYNLEVSKSAEISGALFKAVDLGRFQLQDLASTIGNVTVIAGQLGASYQEVLAMLSQMTIAGIKYNEASTQLRGIMIKLIQPTDETKELLRSLGFESGEAAVKALGLLGVIREIEKATNGSSTEIYQYINRIRGVSGTMVFMGEGGEKAANALDLITNSSKEFTTAVDIMVQNAGIKNRIALQELKQFFTVDLGQDAVQAISLFVSRIPLVEGALYTLVAAAPVAAAAIVGLLYRLGQFLRLGQLMMLSNPAVAAVVALSVAFVTLTAITREYYKAQSKVFDDLENQQREAEKHAKRLAEIRSAAALKVTSSLSQLIGREIAATRRAVTQMDTALSKSIESTKIDVGLMAEDIESAFRNTVNVIKNSISEIDKSLDKIKEFNDSSKDVVRDLQFDLTFAGADNAQKQIELILSRIAELRRVRNEEDATPERIIGATNEIQSLLKQINDIRLKHEEEVADLQSKAGKQAAEDALKRRELVRAVAKIEEEIATTTRETRGKDRREAVYAKNQELKEAQAALQDFDEAAALEKAQLDKKLEDIGVIKSAEFDLIKSVKRAQDEARAALREQELALIEERKQKELELATARKQEVELDLYSKSFEKVDEELKDLLDKGGKREDILKVAEEWAKVSGEYKSLLETLTPGVDTAALDRWQQLVIDRISGRMEQDEKILPLEAGQQAIEKLQKSIEAANASLAADEARLKSWELLRERLIAAGRQGTLWRESTPTEEFARVGTWITDLFGWDEWNKKLNEIFNEAQIPASLSSEARQKLEQQIAEAKNQILQLNKEMLGLQVDVGLGTKAVDEATKEVTKSTLIMLAEIRKEFERTAEFVRNLSSTSDIPVKRALGGIIPSGRDVIPTLLSPGEFVVNAVASKRFYSQLVAMNTNRYSGGSAKTTNVGDINISLNSSGRASVDAVAIGHAIKREIRRGTLTL
jgi:TP901 family phage tail tape measure protein